MLLNGGFSPFSYPASQAIERFGYGSSFSFTVSRTKRNAER
jgi:hypothetical protein